MNGLLQGEPTSGGQLFVSGGNNEGDCDRGERWEEL